MPAITRDSDLDNLQAWLQRVNRLRPQWAFSITVALIATIVTLFAISNVAGGFVGIGAGVVFFISFVQIASAAYIPILDIALFNRLPYYHFRIYAPNPSQSRSVQAIYRLTTSPSLSFSVMLTLLSFFVSFMVEEQRWIISLVVLVGWIPLIAAFTQSQRSLARIIQRAKHSVLDDIAARVHSLSQQLDEQTSRSEMQWFMEYHDRILKTPNSLIDLGSVLQFSFSLLLPLIVVALQVLVAELLKRVL